MSEHNEYCDTADWASCPGCVAESKALASEMAWDDAKHDDS